MKVMASSFLFLIFAILVSGGVVTEGLDSNFNQILLDRQVIDTRLGIPEIPQKMRSSGFGKRLMLIQFTAPPLDKDIRFLTETTVQIFDFGVKAQATAEQVISLASSVVSPPREALRGRYIKVRVATSGNRLAEIARLQGVVMVEPCPPCEPHDERHDETIVGNLYDNHLN